MDIKDRKPVTVVHDGPYWRVVASEIPAVPPGTEMLDFVPIARAGGYVVLGKKHAAKKYLTA